MKNSFTVIKAFILIHLIMLLSFLINSCCTDYYCLYIEGIKVQNYDNSGINPELQLNDTIPALAFMLELSFITNEQICKLFHGVNIGIGTANAISCDFIIEFENQISDLSIYSTADFNDEFPAGADLSELFKSKSIDELNQTLKTEYKGLNFNYYLLKKPNWESIHQFIIQIELTNGQIFSDTTQNVVLSFE